MRGAPLCKAVEMLFIRKAINPRVNFNGTAKVAFTFYKSAFGGEF